MDANWSEAKGKRTHIRPTMNQHVRLTGRFHSLPKQIKKSEKKGKIKKTKRKTKETTTTTTTTTTKFSQKKTEWQWPEVRDTRRFYLYIFFRLSKKYSKPSSKEDHRLRTCSMGVDGQLRLPAVFFYSIEDISLFSPPYIPVKRKLGKIKEKSSCTPQQKSASRAMVSLPKYAVKKKLGKTR